MKEKEAIAKCFKLVDQYFKHDKVKIFAWFGTINPWLGNEKPIDMIKKGRAKKLLQFIETQKMENLWEKK